MKKHQITLLFLIMFVVSGLQTMATNTFDAPTTHDKPAKVHFEKNDPVKKRKKGKKEKFRQRVMRKLLKGEKLNWRERLAVKIAKKRLAKRLKKARKAQLKGKKPAKGAEEKSKLVAALLAWFLGGLGIHRFYLGYTTIGIIQILTLGGCGIWALIDFIRILTGDLKAKDGSALK